MILTRSARIILTYALIGGLTFWGPDIVLHAKRYEDLLIRSSLLPLVVLASYWIVSRYHRAATGPSVAISMLLGMWLLGSTAMMIGASFYGGGFAMGRSDVMTVILLGLIPPYTLMMAAYDGSVLGLLFGSLLLLAAHLKYERHHWVAPPPIGNWLRRGYKDAKNQEESGLKS